MGFSRSFSCPITGFVNVVALPASFSVATVAGCVFRSVLWLHDVAKGVAVTHFRTSVEAKEAHHGALGGMGSVWERTTGTDAFPGLPTAANVQKPDSLVGVPDLFDTSSSDIADIASTVPDLDPATANTSAPTWRQVHTVAGASLGGTPRVGTTNLASKPTCRTRQRPVQGRPSLAQIRGRHGPTPAPPLPLVAPGTQLLRPIPWPPPDGNAVPVTPRRAPPGLRDDQDVAVHPFH